MNILQASPMGWHGAPGVPTAPVVTKVVRLDVPVDKFPNVCSGLKFDLQIMEFSLASSFC